MPALDTFLIGLGPLPVGGLVILIAGLLLVIVASVDYAIECGRSQFFTAPLASAPPHTRCRTEVAPSVPNGGDNRALYSIVRIRIPLTWKTEAGR